MNPDEMTLKRASKRDPDAFEQIVLMYQNRLFGLCLRMMGNEHDALDAAQETFIKIYQNLPGYRNIASFSTWAYRIATNTCLDMLRKRKNTFALSTEALEEEGVMPAIADESAESAVVKSESYRLLTGAIDSLPEDQRAVIVLRDVHGLSYEEISSILSLNINTVKSRISRGRQALRKTLNDRPELFIAGSV